LRSSTSGFIAAIFEDAPVDPSSRFAMRANVSPAFTV
jgi:hypothetical protein